MKKKFNRRDLLKASLFLGGGAAAAMAKFFGDSASKGLSFTASDSVFLPNVLRYEPTDEPAPELPPGSGGVVHVHAGDALLSSWNYQLDYWNYVDQNTVDRMVDDGIKTLTGQTSLTAAWRTLIPNYKNGEIVAIKVSFNNGDKDDETMIDGIIEPVNAIIRGLHSIGIPYASIVVFDSQRPIRQRFIDGCLDAGVQFRDSFDDPWGTGSNSITFRPPSQPAIQQHISKEVARANYLINVPVLKRHGGAGVSMGLKNHYGTIEDPGSIHTWTMLGGINFPTTYNTYSPIVELNQHPDIAGKTILIVGDAIFGAFDNNGEASRPTRWITFDRQSPKSLFFSTDPVAVDCVMCDILQAEQVAIGRPIDTRTLAHLSLAEKAGLGVYELGDPWNKPYSKIEYRKFEV